MLDETFLSICIPTFNRADKLRRLLGAFGEELKLFDLKGKLEIFIADNCSSDNTESVVDEYKELFGSSLRYYKHPSDIGGDANVDFLYKNARGEYVWFFGDDDIPINNAIAEVVNSLRCYHPSAMLFAFVQPNAPHPFFDIVQRTEVITDDEKAVYAITKWPKVSMCIIERKILNENDISFLKPYVGTGWYFLTLTLYIFYISSRHSLLLYREPLAMADDEYSNLRYSPRLFGNIGAAISLPYIIEKFPQRINDFRGSPEVNILSLLLQDKLGSINFDKAIKRKEYRWVARNFIRLLRNAQTRSLLISLVIVNSPFERVLQYKAFKKLKNTHFFKILARLLKGRSVSK